MNSGAVLLIVGALAVCLGAGMWWSARLWAVVDTPTVQAGHAFPGRIEVRGRAARAPGAPPLTSPLTGEACAWWSVEVEQRVGSGKNRRWKRRARHASGRISVHDDTGHVLVEVPDTGPISVRQEILEPGDLPSVTTSMLAAVAAGTPLHALRSATARAEATEPSLAARLVLAVATPFSADSDLSRLSDSWRVIERRVGDGDPFYALGHATVTDEGLLIAPSDRGRVIIFHGDERAFVSRLRRQAWAALGAFVIGTGLAAAAVSGTPTGSGELRWDLPVGLLGAWLALLALLAVQAVRVRNRIVAARQQVLAAWRLISVADQRRAALAPQLAETVSAAMGHERLLALLAEARTRSEEASGAPTTEHVDASSAAHRAGRRAVAVLWEAMPELRTRPNVAHLMGELVRLEDGVAAARHYYNDARTVLTDRITTVPDAWLAPFAGPVPAELVLDGSRPGSAPLR